MMDSNTELYQRYNVDDVFNRNVIAGLLYLLNNRVSYTQTWDDNVVETVSVPFAYDFGSSEERFAQDNYTFFGRECFSEKMIDGKFDMLPRFAIKYSGSSIDSNNITNRFVQGRYTRQEDDEIKSYVAYMYSIPVTMNIECEGWIDNLDTAFKIEQSIRSTFYKNKTYNILFRGMKVGCCVGFPETDSVEKTVSYSFDNERQIKMTFSLAIETYQPCFDESVEIPSENVIEYFGFDVDRYDSHNGPLSKKVNLKFDMDGMDIEDRVIHAGRDFTIKWKSTSNVSDVCTVSIYTECRGKREQISAPFFNRNEYVWNVPITMRQSVEQPSFTFVLENGHAVRYPTVMVFPDDKGFVGGDDTICILDSGEFSDNATNVSMLVEFIDDSGTPSCYTYSCTISDDRKLESISPTFDKFFYKIPNKQEPIKLIIEYPNDTSIFDEIDNILIL